MTSPPRPLDHLSQPPSHQNPGSSGEHTPTHRSHGIIPFQHHHREENNSQDSDDFATVAGSWWGDRNREGNRPWHNPPKRRKTIPQGQTIAYERTKQAVRKALKSILGNALDAGHEVLHVGIELLKLAPVVGLYEAASVLLKIWDNVEAVAMNRLSCLRLTERCATILYSVRSEIDSAGVDVTEALKEPIERLTDTFRQVEHFIRRQVERPFLKRYLKRDEDALKIMACDAALTDCVGLFSIAIQVRMFKELQSQGRTRQVGTPPNPQDVLAAIATMRNAQAEQDSALDMADLHTAMRVALRMRSDVAMLDVLQINRADLPEAMKTIQRALEDPRVSIGRVPQQKAIEPPGALGLTNITWNGNATSSTDELAHDTWVPLESSLSQPAGQDPEQDAAFHREFLESGLDALRRLSGQASMESLPPWTITRWEVDREGRIGVGFFSDVFHGIWRGRQVAIKILNPTTPRKLFRREIAIWASLKHPYVLELFGASSAAGDPPWFFVSPYMKNGTLVTFLKGIDEKDGLDGRKGYPGPLQMMHEIAIGMAYLHRKDVLHGDLKANNVLIDDDLHCVISDFGQSELRSEVRRLSHAPQPHGAIRWQAPEILAGDGVLTPEADVYSFAVLCIEILTYGGLPWAMLDDSAVQQLVLRFNKRPQIPLRPEMSLPLVTLIEQCWNRAPSSRPPFEAIARGLGHLDGGLKGSKFSPSPRGKVIELIKEEEERRVSPELAPMDLPSEISSVNLSEPGASLISIQPEPTTERHVPPLLPETIPLQRVVTPSSETSSKRSSLNDMKTSEVFTSSPDDTSETDYGRMLWDGYESPPPLDDHVAARINERRYRLLLQHNFNPSLNLPLWDPTPVRLGDVGYLGKPSGTFVTLFNAYNPKTNPDARSHGLPSIHGYGVVRDAFLRQDRRNVAQKGFDIIQGLLTFIKNTGGSDGTFSRAVLRRHTFPLRSGHKQAYVCTEHTTYRYMVNMDAAKAWFKSNIQEILRLYGYEHSIHREDVFLIIGTLEARDWGLFVSHEHPDGQVHFNVYAERREGQDWGSFSTDTDLSPSIAGPVYTDNHNVTPLHASKISVVRGASDSDLDAVLLARLRFKPDIDEPTRL